MKTIRITALRQTVYADLMAQYEKPLAEPCSLREGQVFYSHEGQRPAGFCPSAWHTLRPFVHRLAAGEGHIYGEWMKDPHSALLSCNDGFRPMSFLIETVAEADGSLPD